MRPILEYNSSIWNPHTNYKGNAKVIEKVQSLFTKRLFYRCNISIASYSNHLIYFNIKSLSHRRLIRTWYLHKYSKRTCGCRGNIYICYL